MITGTFAVVVWLVVIAVLAVAAYWPNDDGERPVTPRRPVPCKSCLDGYGRVHHCLEPTGCACTRPEVHYPSN